MLRHGCRVLSVFFVLLLSGCAFGTRMVNLGPIPVRPLGGEKRTCSAKILISPAKDSRYEKGSIGCVRNGFGMKTAKVVANGDVADWVRDLAADGLKEYGYSVETQDDLSDEVPPGALRVVLEVHNVYCKAYSKYEADVSLTARVVDGAGAATEETYMGRATNMNWAASSSGYQKTLRQAMQNCLNATIPDLDKRIASTCPAVSP